MATRIEGEKYWGGEARLPLSRDTKVSIYAWPCRILEVGGQGVGGPTIGIDVGNHEVVRFDCHGGPGHWHGRYGGKGGAYDTVGAEGSSQSFPKGLTDVSEQVRWSLHKIMEEASALLAQAGYLDAAGSIDPALVKFAVDEINDILPRKRILRSNAIYRKLITAP